MKIAVIAACALLSGCALIPVQDATLHNADGDTVTCHQVGRGLISYWVGKSNFQTCMDRARASGYK